MNDKYIKKQANKKIKNSKSQEKVKSTNERKINPMLESSYMRGIYSHQAIKFNTDRI